MATHALAWSCDAELGVAADDVIYILLPSYNDSIWHGASASDTEATQRQFSVSLQISSKMKPDADINSQLFEFAGIPPPVKSAGEDDKFHGVGNGVVTGSGAAVCQAVRLEWSPNGLGVNARPVLAVMLTHGGIVILGEHINPKPVKSGLHSRSFRDWKILWGIGAGLPIPDKMKMRHRWMQERITSFSWAREVGIGRALMCYVNDDREVVILTVQFHSASQPEQTNEADSWGWEVEELARFDGGGPHKVRQPLPSGGR